MSESICIIENVFPGNILALTTTRAGGRSDSPWNSFNLAAHVGDCAEAVAANRRLLQQDLNARQAGEVGIAWLNQVHGTDIVRFAGDPGGQVPNADGAYTEARGLACAVMTADCLPVLLADAGGRAVAAVHAGWRGLVNGVVEQALACFSTPKDDIIAWLGPAIGAGAFEVGAEVRQAFIDKAGEEGARVDACFNAIHQGKYLADLKRLCLIRLQAAGVNRITVDPGCTLSEPDRYFSYRRDGQTGRMASLIYIS